MAPSVANQNSMSPCLCGEKFSQEWDRVPKLSRSARGMPVSQSADSSNVPSQFPTAVGIKSRFHREGPSAKEISPVFQTEYTVVVLVGIKFGRLPSRSRDPLDVSRGPEPVEGLRAFA